MIRPATFARHVPFAAALSLTALALAGCQTAAPTVEAGAQATAEGRVVAIDRDPWAYDGNATMQVDTASGPVTVEIPARLNLCPAPGVGAFPDIEVGDRVRASGEAGADGHITVCNGAGHALQQLD